MISSLGRQHTLCLRYQFDIYVMNRIFNPVQSPSCRSVCGGSGNLLCGCAFRAKGRNSYHYELGKALGLQPRLPRLRICQYISTVSARSGCLTVSDVSFVPVYVRDISREKQAQAAYATRGQRHQRRTVAT